MLLWLIGQLGILLECVGAVILVVAAFKNKKESEKINATNETNASWKDLSKAAYIIKKTILDQATTELYGFILLVFGLILQFVGAWNVP